MFRVQIVQFTEADRHIFEVDRPTESRLRLLWVRDRADIGLFS